MTLRIFLSHSSKYSDLAVQLKRSLQALEAAAPLDIRISEDMAGARNWRQWIEENVRSSDVFLLLYPHAAMDMGWCNYELGRFYNDDMNDRHIVCIRNTDIALPPAAFQPYQSYEASPDGLSKFLKELFVEGAFTRQVALNKDVGKVGNAFFARASDVCDTLAAQFAQARMEERFYERRIGIALSYDDDGRLDHASSAVQGNPEALALLGQASATTLAALRAGLGPTGEWLVALERALPEMVTGLPPALPPYRVASGEIYIPIVVRAEIGDGFPRQVAVIFVSAGIELLRPILGWPFPDAMPKRLTYLVLLFRSMFKARWDILEPSYHAVRFKGADAVRRKEIAQNVVSRYEELQQTSEREGHAGIGQFYEAFEINHHPEVDACIEEWIGLMKLLREAVESEGNGLEAILNGLNANNKRWLSVTATQFSYVISNLR
jgi:hypothetical protein